MTNYEDAKLDEIGKRFLKFEEEGDWQATGKDSTNLLRLSSAIQEAEQILIEMQPYGNAGIIASQTSLYLALALSHRADYHFWVGFVRNQDPELHARCVIEDSDRAKKISSRWGWDSPAGVTHYWRSICLRTLHHYAQAIEEAEHEAQKAPSSENSIILVHAYRAIGDYNKAIEAATEAIKLAHNDHFRNRAWQTRADIYREIDDTVAAERDQQQAEVFDERLRTKAQ